MKFGPQYKSILSLTILFWAYNLFGRRYSPHIPKNIIRVFFLDFRFSSRKSQSQQKLAKKINDFSIRFNSKHLTYFINLNSLDIENNILPKHNKKPFSLCKFSSKHVSVWYQKKKLQWTISWHPRTAIFKHFERKCLYISVYLFKKKFCSKDVVRFYLVG